MTIRRFDNETTLIPHVAAELKRRECGLSVLEQMLEDEKVWISDRKNMVDEKMNIIDHQERQNIKSRIDLISL